MESEEDIVFASCSHRRRFSVEELRQGHVWIADDVERELLFLSRSCRKTGLAVFAALAF